MIPRFPGIIRFLPAEGFFFAGFKNGAAHPVIAVVFHFALIFHGHGHTILIGHENIHAALYFEKRALSLKGDDFCFFFHDAEPLLFLKNHNDIIIQKSDKKTTGIFVVIRQKNCYTVKRTSFAEVMIFMDYERYRFHDEEENNGAARKEEAILWQIQPLFMQE